MCNAHYLLSRKYPAESLAQIGARAKRTRTADEVIADITRRLVRSANGCLEWQGAADKHGYGNVRWSGKLWGAHRLLYHLTVAPVAPGVEVCHSCDNPPCCDTSHLFVGSHRANMLDAAGKGRMPGNGGASGVRNGRSRLSEDDVRAIRAAHERQVDIAARFGISQAVVSKIRRGESYRDVR